MVDSIIIQGGSLVVTAIVTILILVYLFKPKNFYRKYVDIKEVPLNVDNALKDVIKRQIMKTLKREKKYLTAIAKEVDHSVAKTKYHLHELEKLGLIASLKLTREKFFLLTERGKVCLNAIYIYYPKNNFEKIVNKMKSPNLKWKEKPIQKTELYVS